MKNRCNSLALLTLTSLSLSSSCRRRSSISASISPFDMLSGTSDIFFPPNVDVRGLEMPLKFNDCSFKCLFASLTRMIMRSLSRIFCAYFLFRSCALKIYLCLKSENYKWISPKINDKSCLETDLLHYLPASSYVSVLLSLHYARVIILEALLELQQDALKQYLAVSPSDSKYDFLPLVPTCQNPKE